MYDLDTYPDSVPDSVPDLSSLLRYTMPDEADDYAELARLRERSDVYRTLKELGMLGYARKLA